MSGQTNSWVGIRREDGETVGYLEPLDPDFGQVRPRNVLGHPVGEAGEYMAGEALLLERGLAELAENWTLDGQGQLSILEVSPQGIVLADALKTKALVDTERLTLPWPDTAGRLSVLGRR